MGDFLIVQIHDGTPPTTFTDDTAESTPLWDDNEAPTTLWAVDLREDRVINGFSMDELYFHQDYTFNKYGENQIIKFGGQNVEKQKVFRSLHRIVVNSFKRIISLIFAEVFCLISSWSFPNEIWRNQSL